MQRISFLSAPLPGLLLALFIAVGAGQLADTALAERLGLNTLTLAIVIGIFVGNVANSRIGPNCMVGLDVAKTTLLRLGIVLYGFRITFQDIATVGWSGLLIAASVLGLTFLLAVLLGTRVLKLDRDTSMLIGAGSAICGAAAVMAAAPVVKGQAHKVSIAVATVVVFGTLAMLLYPLLYPYLGLSEHGYGILVGSTLHEVAQVVVAGGAVGDQAATVAVIEKMLRVMMLAPFLLLLSFYLRSADGKSGRTVSVPWFAVFFVLVAALNSLAIMPVALVQILVQVDTMLLAVAMAALGLTTRLDAIRLAGLRPLLLACALFLFLVVGGYLLNIGLAA